MYCKEIKYTDYNGIERNEKFYFNLNKAEIFEMQMTTEGGLAEKIQNAVAKQDVKSVVTIFKDVVLKAYGEKSADGKRFIKSEELSKEFEQTEAYSNLIMELVTDTKAAEAFINGTVPVMTAEQKQQAEEKIAELNK